MKKYNLIKTAVLTAALAICMILPITGIQKPMKSYAMAVSGQLEKALQAEIERLNKMTDLENQKDL